MPIDVFERRCGYVDGTLNFYLAPLAHIGKVFVGLNEVCSGDACSVPYLHFRVEGVLRVICVAQEVDEYVVYLVFDVCCVGVVSFCVVYAFEYTF